MQIAVALSLMGHQSSSVQFACETGKDRFDIRHGWSRSVADLTPRVFGKILEATQREAHSMRQLAAGVRGGR